MEAPTPPLLDPSSARLGFGDAGKKSYAQVMTNTVEQSPFHLPMRYPIEVDGEPCFVLTELKMTKVADDFKFALVLKFTHTRPSIDEIRNVVIKSWGLLEVPIISFMDDHHVLLQMKNELDFVHGMGT